MGKKINITKIYIFSSVISIFVYKHVTKGNDLNQTKRKKSKNNQERGRVNAFYFVLDFDVVKTQKIFSCK